MATESTIPKRIMTVDLEPDLRSKNCKSIEIILPKLLNFFDDNKMKATFFTVTSLLEKYESDIKAIGKKHEIASHSHTHSRLTANNAETEIRLSKEQFKEYRIPCLGFRAPRFVVTKNHFLLLTRYGYQYDASLATYFPGRYRNLSLPRQPFRHKNILEFPMPTFVYPSINAGLSYLKLFHPLSKAFQQKYMFYLHPWEFLEKRDLPENTALLSSLLKRNAGKKAWTIFHDFIAKEDAHWISCQDWINWNGHNKIR